MQHHFRCKTHQTLSNRKPREFGLRNLLLFELCRFLWIFPPQTFPLSSNTLHYTFPLLVHMSTVALSILFSSNTLRIMSKVSALYLESLRPKLLCIGHPKSPKCPIVPRFVLKTFLCCDNGAKQPPRKCELHKYKKFDE